jgi:hypothetical protein
MMLDKGRRKYIATICERFLTVAFAAAFASEFFTQIHMPLKAFLLIGIVTVMTFGFLASTE